MDDRAVVVLRLTLIVALIVVSGCTFDSAIPKITGAFSEHAEWQGDPGDGGFESNREISGALNKFWYRGDPAVLRFTWKFDWIGGRKLPGEK